LPGKLYEYMAAKRFILAMGRKGSDADTLLLQTKTGIFENLPTLEIHLL